jgi:hypothetical protein
VGTGHSLPVPSPTHMQDKIVLEVVKNDCPRLCVVVGRRQQWR